MERKNVASEILLWLKVLVARLATMATEDYWQKEAQNGTRTVAFLASPHYIGDNSVGK